MAKVDCFDIPGLECWFWSNDHGPPHFHAKRAGEWEIRVNFLEDEMFERVWGNRPGRGTLQALKRLVIANRAALLVEWEAKVKQ